MTHHHPAAPRRCRRGLLGLAVLATSVAVAAPAFAATVAAGGPYAGAEGRHLAIHGTVSGAGSATWSATRAPGGEQDGATCRFADASALSTEVWCNDDGTFDLTLTASDGSSDTTRLTLTNLPPVLTGVSPTTGTAVGTHTVVNVAARFGDGDPADSHKYVIQWGDGSSSRAPTRLKLDGTGAFSGTHTYARGGTRKVTVTVFDSHGATDSVTRSLQVVGGSPCGTVNGAGRLPGHRDSHFFLQGHCGSSGVVGSARLRLPGQSRFVSTHLALLRHRGRHATLAGIGRWRPAGHGASHPGYGFVISVLDRRSGRDRMSVSVRTPAGVTVLHLRGRIAGGNITVRR